MSLRLVKGPKGSPNHYLRGTVRGASIYETTGTADPDIAEAIRIKREAELLHTSVFGSARAEDHTFAEAALDYIENGGEGKHLGVYDEVTGKWTRLLGVLGHLPLKSIGQEQANKAAQALYPNCENSTKKRHCYGPLCAVINHAVRLGWCPPVRIRHPKVKPVVTTYSSLERTAKLLPHCAPQLRLYIIMTAYTGARLSEALAVEWERDVELARKKITFQRTKNGKKRVVEIHNDLLVELSKVPSQDRKGRVFSWTNKRSVYVPLKNACKRAGVDYLPPHQQGRHTFASNLRIYGKRDVKGIMQDGGWDSMSSVMRYLHTDPGESIKAVQELPSLGVSVENPRGENQVVAKPVKPKRVSP